jgi:hypothetical protein
VRARVCGESERGAVRCRGTVRPSAVLPKGRARTGRYVRACLPSWRAPGRPRRSGASARGRRVRAQARARGGTGREQVACCVSREKAPRASARPAAMRTFFERGAGAGGASAARAAAGSLGTASLTSTCAAQAQRRTADSSAQPPSRWRSPVLDPLEWRARRAGAFRARASCRCARTRLAAVDDVRGCAERRGEAACQLGGAGRWRATRPQQARKVRTRTHLPRRAPPRPPLRTARTRSRAAGRWTCPP